MALQDWVWTPLFFGLGVGFVSLGSNDVVRPTKDGDPETAWINHGYQLRAADTFVLAFSAVILKITLTHYTMHPMYVRSCANSSTLRSLNSVLFLAHSTSPNKVWSAILHMMLKVLRRSCFPRQACSLWRLANTRVQSCFSSGSACRSSFRKHELGVGVELGVKFCARVGVELGVEVGVSVGAGVERTVGETGAGGITEAGL